MPQLMTALTRQIERRASESRAVYWLASQYYNDVVRKEIALGRISESDHVLCIGGGICPFSAILIHRATGARVTVIDSCAACASRARLVVERLGLGGHVRALRQDGGDGGIPFSEYSVVHFALQVSPMKHVFSRVEGQVARGTRLLVRRPKSHLSCLYCALPECVTARCPHVAHKKTRNIGSTMLYVKGGAT